MARPVNVVIHTASKRPSRAAPRAGTISRLVAPGSSPVIGAAKMMAMPAMTTASIQLTTPIGVGASPSSSAPSSFSAVALVARPKAVKRYISHSPPATTTARRASNQRSAGAWTPRIVTSSVGRGPSMASEVAPAPSKRSPTMPIM